MACSSSARSDLYKQLTDAIVEEASSRFTDFIAHDVRSIDPKQWKPIKSREQVVVYRDVLHRSDTVLPNYFSRSSELEDWIPSTRLLCVGKLRGSIEEAMHGCLAPTHNAMVTRSMYLKDQLVNHRVLEHVHKPTANDPFRYLGLRRAVRPSQMKGMLRAREITFIEATGMRDVYIDGRVERRGYVVWHSVNHGQDQPTKHETRAVQARISLWILFRELCAGVVEVYGALSSDPGGKVTEKVAATSIASVLIAVSRVMECAFSKKLFRMLQTRTGDESTLLEIAPRVCCCCVHKASSFTSLTACELCHEPMCSKCTIQRKLAFPQSKRKVFRRHVHLCKRCVTHARRLQNAVEQHPRQVTEAVSTTQAGRYANADEDVDALMTPPSSTLPDVREGEDRFDACTLTETFHKVGIIDHQHDVVAKKINDLVRAAEETHQLAWRLSEACTKLYQEH